MSLPRAQDEHFEKYREFTRILRQDPEMCVFVAIEDLQARFSLNSVGPNSSHFVSRFSDEMGWLMSFDIVEGDPGNVVDPKWKSVLYLSSHKLAIHMKVLAQLLHAASSILDDLAPHLRRLSAGEPLDSVEILHEIEDVSRVLTLLNAHNYTGWNIRKQLILHNPTNASSSSTSAPSSTEATDAIIMERCKRELKHISLAQTKRPKPNEAWAHRAWVLRTMEGLNTDKAKQEVINGEKQRCQAAATGHKRNYYAWKHRLILLHRWISDAPQSLNSTDQAALVDEFNLVWDWLKRNFNDASAAHHCLATLQHLGWNRLSEFAPESTKASCTLSLSALLEESSKYIELYTAGETWWYTRRFLVAHTIMYALGEHGSSEDVLTCKALFQTETETINRFSTESSHRLNSLRHGVWIADFYKKALLRLNKEVPETLLDDMAVWMKQLDSLNWRPTL